jgi:F-type H+-transporting ATPase subunit delta
VTNRAALSRYARALLEVAERHSNAEDVATDLDTYARVVQEHGELARVLHSPAIPPAKKADAVRALASQLGLTPLVTQLLTALAERDRLAVVPQLAPVYRDRLLARRNVVSAEVTTAVPIPSEKVEAIGRRLGEVMGKQVRLSSRVDASIIGGVVARVGSTVYDGSIDSQLARMRQKLVENA